MNACLHDSPEVATRAPDVQQRLRTPFAEGLDPPIARAVDLVVRLGRGDADALSGWYLSVDDDLDALVRQHATAPRADRRTLRLQL